MACAVADLLRDIFFVAMRSLVEQEDKGKHVKASRVAGPVPAGDTTGASFAFRGKLKICMNVMQRSRERLHASCGVSCRNLCEYLCALEKWSHLALLLAQEEQQSPAHAALL